MSKRTYGMQLDYENMCRQLASAHKMRKDELLYYVQTMPFLGQMIKARDARIEELETENEKLELENAALKRELAGEMEKY